MDEFLRSYDENSKCGKLEIYADVHYMHTGKEASELEQATIHAPSAEFTVVIAQMGIIYKLSTLS